MYNIRQQDQILSVDLQVLLNSDDIKTEYKFSTDFNLVNSKVHDSLLTDFMQADCVPRLEFVLSKKIPVLYYNGQDDLIVCTPCTESWLDLLKFDQAKEW